MGHACRFAAFLLASFLLAARGQAEAAPSEDRPDLTKYPHAVSSTYTVHRFRFDTGDEFPELKLHYTTLGQPRRNAAGRVDNAVLLLHSTVTAGTDFLKPAFAGVLFGPGQLLDAARYYIIMPDAIGAGQSSKPSDGLHMRFPKYGYNDMVRAQHLLVTEGLGIDHARLILGTSMGCMHTFLWGEAYPGFADALMPLACLPVEVGGRNRIARTMITDAITKDPAFDGGEYKTEPAYGLRIADQIKTVMVESPLRIQEEGPTAAQADRYFKDKIDGDLKTLDANNFLYLFNASRDYDPQPKLNSIQAPLTLVNSADDFIDPPELGIAQKTIAAMPHGRYVLLPITPETRGHLTFGQPAVWQPYLRQLLDASSLKP